MDDAGEGNSGRGPYVIQGLILACKVFRNEMESEDYDDAEVVWSRRRRRSFLEIIQISGALWWCFPGLCLLNRLPVAFDAKVRARQDMASLVT